MKKILSLLLLVFSVSSAYAVPSISLNTMDTAGVFTDGSFGTVCDSGVLVLLAWSADSTYTTPVQGSIPSVRGSAFGSDYLLYSENGNVPGGFDVDLDGALNYTSLDVGGNSIVSGYVYLMLFANSSPVAGTKYIISPMTFPLTDSSSGLTTPDNVDISPGGAYFGQPGLSGVVAVPEPSTVGLLLVGAGLVALRRARRS